jgi:hypothetical protein
MGVYKKMKTIKRLSIALLILFTTSGCTAWPSLFALLLGGNKSGGSPMLILPPSSGGGEPAPSNDSDKKETPDDPNKPVVITPDVPPNNTPTEVTVSSVLTDSASGYYTVGNEIFITMTFSDTVTVTGTPYILLNNEAKANYISGSGTNTLTFSYIVDSLHDINGLDIKSTSSLVLNGGTITHSGSANANITLPVPNSANTIGGTKNIVIDTIAPTVSSVLSTTANGTYNTGKTVDILVTFSENVTVDTASGTPVLTLNTGATNGVAAYVGGSSSNTLTFRYTVSAGQSSSDLDYLSTTALSLNGGKIRDRVSLDAVLTLPAPSNTNSLSANADIVIDAVAPFVSNISSTNANGVYGFGATISLQVTFNEVVTVNTIGGIPTLSLGTTPTAGATYTSGTGTNTLTFTYTVGTGENTADLDTLSLNLNGGTIQDSATNDAAFTGYPTGVAIGSLATNKNIVIDTNIPSVSFVLSSSSGLENTVTSPTIQVKLNSTSLVSTSIDYSVTGGTATNGTDYTLPSGTLTFAPGEDTKTIPLSITPDAIYEDNETVIISLSNPGLLTLGAITSHTYTITNDDAAPVVAFNATTSNGSEATTTVNIPVTLTGGTALTATVNYSVTGGTATGGGVDYTLANGTLTFTAGTTTQNISITVVNDTLPELNETIEITLSGQTNSTLGTPVHTYTINDNDPPTISFNTTASGGSESVASVTIPVSLSGPQSGDVTVNYAVTGTASGGGVDYTLANGTVTFTAGETSKNLTLAIHDDLIDEDDETVIITLSAPSGGTLGSNTVYTYTINDNDAAGVTLSKTTAAVTEGGATDSYTIVLNTQPTANVMISVEMNPQIVTVAPLTFTPANWNTPQTVNVVAIDDKVAEGIHPHTILHTAGSTDIKYNEINIANVVVTITDNDSKGIVLSKSTAAVTEGGVTDTYTIQLNSEPTSNVTIAFDTGDQIQAISSIIFTPENWNTAQTVTITAIDDNIAEGTHTPSIVHTASGGDYADITATVTVTITDNDIRGVTITQSGGFTTIAEGGATDTYTVVLNTKPSASVTIAITPDAQSTVSPTTLTFTTDDWNTARTVTVTAVDDAVVEGNHFSTINHTINTVPMGRDTSYDSVIISSVTANITDNDSAGISLVESGGSTNITEGGSTDSYSIVLTSAPTADVTITITPAAGPPAQSGVNPTSLVFTSLDWNAPQTVTVTAIDDAVYEGNHTTTISHSASSADGNYNGFTISSVTVNITDNEIPPTISINNVSVTEGNIGTVDAVFTVSLSHQSATAITVDYETADNTAKVADSDYFAKATTTLTIPAFTSSNTITVQAIGDTKDEDDETFYVNLTNPVGGTIGTAQGTGTITNDDTSPTVQFVSTSGNSIDESSTNRTVAISLSAPSGKPVSVVVTDAGGTATPGTDYTAIGSPLTVNFAAGETGKSVTIAVIQDLLYEGNETVILTLSSPTNATLGTNTVHTFTIIDDEIYVASAETMDCNNNGKIDHYKLTFSVAVKDDTFPGYSFNSLGSPTTDWLVSGHTNVTLRHGASANASCGVTDSINDAVIYLAFDEGLSYDTDSKPDLTTSATPTLLGLATGTVSIHYTATVTELDRARPIILSATGSTNSNLLTVTFSEPVWGNSGMPACGAGGELDQTKITYTNVSGNGAASLTGMGADTCATDSNAIFAADVIFSSTDNTDTVAATANVYDAANNTGNPIPKTLSITAGNPTIVSIEEYDTNSNGKIDQLKVTFSLPMKDSSISDTDASQFTVGGTAAIKVKSGTSGTGTILPPNNDTGTADDAIVTLFTNDITVSGTAIKPVVFTTAAGKWLSSTDFELLSATDLTTVTIDKAPPVILTAVAAPTGNTDPTVDSGDTLTITFSEPTDMSINAGNLSSILTLSSGHLWGGLSSAIWNANGDVLTVTFSGSGSTIKVGDNITIVNTLRDTATVANESLNKVSVTPISGSFGTDTTPPYMVYASDITTNTLIVQFSEAMMMGSGVATENADNKDNYTLIEEPTNACADVTIASLTVLSPSAIKLTLAAAQTFCNIQYRITVETTVKDANGVAMGSPNYLTFIGLERIKVVSATSLTPTTVKVILSKPPLNGMNVPDSAECNTTTECNARYKISPTTGGISNVTSAVVGTGSDNYTVTLTHDGAQTGVAYTVMLANAADLDFFNNGTTCIKDLGSANCIQTAPGDRATFIGTGSICETISCGSFFDDPFYDGTTFSFAFKYDNKIYLGTNDKNNAAFRFDPPGTNAITATFKFIASSQTLGCASTDGFGYITSNIGVAPTCGVNSGPNAEVGAVGFTSLDLTVNSKNYELLGIGGLKNAIDRVYYTQDKDALLDVKNFGITGGNGNNTKSTQVLYGISDKVFVGIASDHGTNSPVLNRAPVSEPESDGKLRVDAPIDLSGNLIPHLGKGNGNGYGGTVGIDFIYRVGDSTYLANNGGLIYVDTSKFLTGAKPNNVGHWSTNFSPALSTPNHADFTGTSLRMPDSNATTGGGLGKVRPGEKAFPYLVLYKGKLYLARNVGTVADGKVNLRGEVWTCTPNDSGQCAPAAWTRIITGSETDLTAGSNAISMLIANGNNLYVGFDNPTNGLEVYRYASTLVKPNPDPTSTTMSGVSWIKQGTNGLGSGSKYIINSVSLYDTGTVKNYLYIVVGNGLGSSAIKVVRQVD